MGGTLMWGRIRWHSRTKDAVTPFQTCVQGSSYPAHTCAEAAVMFKQETRRAAWLLGNVSKSTFPPPQDPGVVSVPLLLVNPWSPVPPPPLFMKLTPLTVTSEMDPLHWGAAEGWGQEL